MPNRLMRDGADTLQVAQWSAYIDKIAIYGRSRSRSGKHETSRGIIGVGPKFLSGFQIETSQGVSDLFVSIEQIYFALDDSRTSKAYA